MPQPRPSAMPQSSIVYPPRSGRVTTTSWVPLCFSKFSSSPEMWLRIHSSMRLARSTTRPLKGGMAGPEACAHAGASRHKSNSRIDGGNRGRLLRDGELGHLLVGGVEECGPPAAGYGGKLGVIEPDRLDVVAPGDRDAVLRPFELGLEGLEVGVRLQLRVLLRHYQ